MGQTIVCDKHQKQLSYLDINKSVSKNERVLCNECNILNKELINFNEAMKMWNDISNKQLNKLQNFKQERIDWMSTLIKLFSTYKEVFIKTINLSIETIEDHKIYISRAIENEINQINELNKDLNIDKIRDIAFILSQKTDSKENKHIANMNLEMIENKKEELFALQEKYQKLLQDEITLIYSKNQAHFQLKPIKFQLTNSIKQIQECYAIAFNQEQNKMISGCGKLIKLWNINEDNIIEIKTLEGHQFNINCLCFTEKSSQYFVSGSCDNQIKIWSNQQEWKCIQTLNIHTQSICNLLFIKNDSKLISCSLDNTIKVLNNNNNNWELQQQLIGHEGSVYAISKNIDDTQLISCGRDKKIIIWDLQTFQKIQIIQTQDYGYRISFIKNNKFIWQKYETSISIVYKYSNINQKFNQISEIELNEINQDGYYLFPSIYNQEQQIFIQKYNKQIYIMREEGETFKIKQTLKLNSNLIFGSFNGNILAVWNEKSKEIQIWINK